MLTYILSVIIVSTLFLDTLWVITCMEYDDGSKCDVNDMHTSDRRVPDILRGSACAEVF